MLKSLTGDDGYPGDTGTSETGRGSRPARAGSSTRSRPKYCHWAEIVDLDPKPPILWTHGAQDIVVADGSPWEMGTLGSLGVVPGGRARTRSPRSRWSRRSARVLERYAARGGRVQSEMFEESGHFPPLDARERWNAAFFGFLESW